MKYAECVNYSSSCIILKKKKTTEKAAFLLFQVFLFYYHWSTERERGRERVGTAVSFVFVPVVAPDAQNCKLVSLFQPL